MRPNRAARLSDGDDHLHADRAVRGAEEPQVLFAEFRNEGMFYEHVTNPILDDLVAELSPRRLMIVAAFKPRGGMTTR